MEHFSGTEHATRTCPRRHLLRNPDVAAVFQLRNELGDAGLGVDGADSITATALEALDVVAAGVEFRTRILKESEAHAVAEAVLRE